MAIENKLRKEIMASLKRVFDLPRKKARQEMYEDIIAYTDILLKEEEKRK